MVSEVVQEFLGHNQHDVYVPLDLKVVSWLLPFDNQGGAYHMVAGCDVEEEGFSLFRSDKDWG